MDEIRLSAIIGMATFNCSSDPTPPIPPAVIAASLPITWQATCITDSHITGFTLPGMIDEPGWVAGSDSSNRPQRGPDPSQRMSLAIFERLTAMVFSSPEASTTQSRVAWASKWLSASWNLMPVFRASFWATIQPNFGFPYIGNANFGVEVSNARPFSAGVYLLSLGTTPGFPIFGGVVYVDLFTLFATVPLGTSAVGSSVLPLALPLNPSWVGFNFSTQGLIIDPAAPQSLAMSPALDITICR